jgi:hypothetical protein
VSPIGDEEVRVDYRDVGVPVDIEVPGPEQLIDAGTPPPPDR